MKIEPDNNKKLILKMQINSSFDLVHFISFSSIFIQTFLTHFLSKNNINKLKRFFSPDKTHFKMTSKSLYFFSFAVQNGTTAS